MDRILIDEVFLDSGYDVGGCDICLCRTCDYRIDGVLCTGNCYISPYDCCTPSCEDYVKREESVSNV